MKPDPRFDRYDGQPRPSVGPMMAPSCHCIEYYGSHHPECPTWAPSLRDMSVGDLRALTKDGMAGHHGDRPTERIRRSSLALDELCRRAQPITRQQLYDALLGMQYAAKCGVWSGLKRAFHAHFSDGEGE